MYLIYVSAKEQNSGKAQANMPEQDLQPIMLAISCDKHRYFLRESDSKHIKTSKPKGYESVDRIFVNLRCADDDEDQEGHHPSDEGLQESMEAGKAQLAVALATIFFGRGKAAPLREDFVDHVRERSRLADRLVIAGYTDSKCSMGRSELLGMERGLSVHQALQEGGVSVPMVVVSRPACAQGKTDTVSRRVEITALFRGGDDDGDEGPGKEFPGTGTSGRTPRTGRKKKASGSRPKTRKSQNGQGDLGGRGVPNEVEVVTVAEPMEVN